MVVRVVGGFPSFIIQLQVVAKSLRNLLFMLVVLTANLPVQASTLLLWPIYPVIESGQNASALWVENRGINPVFLQLRIYAWRQVAGANQYEEQENVLGSPPMMQIEPGQRQLIRLIQQSAPKAGVEAAWRLVLDEIPIQPEQKQANVSASINLQMRYSLPLFSYGAGLDFQQNKDDAGHGLSWRVENTHAGRRLVIINKGRIHARITNLYFAGQERAGIKKSGLIGYVLAHSQLAIPLQSSVPLRDLSAQVNGNTAIAIPRAIE